MKLVVLDGGGPVASSVVARARAAGAEVSHFELEHTALASCLGDFDCWVKSPGQCRSAKDGFDALVQAVHDADVVVYATPLRFGGAGAPLKRVVDRLIGLVHPRFDVRHGLTHHGPRYARYAGILAFAWSEVAPDDEARATFREFISGNAVNQHAPWFRAEAFGLDEPWEARVAQALDAALAGLAGQPVVPVEPRALAAVCSSDACTWGAPARVAVLIGSPRPVGESTSEKLARALVARLGAAEVSFHHALPLAKDGARTRAALEAIAGAELLVVASPLYVDSLPSVATRALERLAARLTRPARLSRVVGLLNCGFPEAAHNRTAMRLVRAFARTAGLGWAGGLAMGGGEAIHGRTLSSLAPMVRHQVRALELAGDALARGEGVPPAASEAMARPIAPSALYRWLGTAQWWWLARRLGNSWAAVSARPLDRTERQQ